MLKKYNVNCARLFNLLNYDFIIISLYINYLMKPKPADERVRRFADYLVDVYTIYK